MDNTVLHEGLWSTDEKEVETFTKRVTAFNLLNLGSPVLLDIIPYEEGDRDNPNPHYKLRLLFQDKKQLENFWTKSY